MEPKFALIDSLHRAKQPCLDGTASKLEKLQTCGDGGLIGNGQGEYHWPGVVLFVKDWEDQQGKRCQACRRKGLGADLACSVGGFCHVASCFRLGLSLSDA